MTISLRLDPVEADLVRRLQQARGSQSAQNTLIGILWEFEDVVCKSQEGAVKDLSYRRLYFELAESTSSLRHQTKKLLAALDQAKVDAGDWKAEKKSRKKARALAR